MHSSDTRIRGFTLIELLVILAIVAVLAAILFPVFVTNHCESPSTHCGAQIRQVVTGLSMYSMDYDERFPPHGYVDGNRSATLPSLLQPYVKNERVWQCPISRKEGDQASAFDGSQNDTTVSYGYNWAGLTRDGRGVSRRQVAQPSECVAFVESRSCGATPHMLVPSLGGTPPRYRHARRMKVAWTDGHVKNEGPGKLEETTTTEKNQPTEPGIDRYRYWNLK